MMISLCTSHTNATFSHKTQIISKENWQQTDLLLHLTLRAPLYLILESLMLHIFTRSPPRGKIITFSIPQYGSRG